MALNRYMIDSNPSNRDYSLKGKLLPRLNPSEWIFIQADIVVQAAGEAN